MATWGRALITSLPQFTEVSMTSTSLASLSSVGETENLLFAVHISAP